MRLFIGLDLPMEVKRHVHKYLLPAQQSQKGWENPHDYHQTLLFIGECSEEDSKKVIERLSDFYYKPFELKFGEFLFFPRRVMYLGFEASAELLELKREIEDLFPEWIRPHGKPFIPHVTVKRWQRYEYDHLQKFLLENQFIKIGFIVDRICLFKSEKDELNRKYHVIFSKVFKKQTT